MEGRHFKVHRAVLACGSEFFARAYDSGFAESHGQPLHLELPIAAWEAAAEFLYTGECTVSKSSLLPMLEVAAMLQMSSLRDVLIDAITKHITPSGFMPAWEAAERLALPDLTKRLSYVVTSSSFQLRQFARSDEFASLPASVVARVKSQENAPIQPLVRGGLGARGVQGLVTLWTLP